MFLLTYVDVESPCNFRGVSSGAVWGVGLWMVWSVPESHAFMEDVTIDGARVSHGVGGVCLDEFAEGGMYGDRIVW